MEEQLLISNHPLVRDGRSQESRKNPALSPENVSIDGRSWEDLLTYVYEMSRQLNYFDEGLQRNADWQAFFQRSGPVQIALISKFDIKAAEKNYDAAVTNFLSGLNRGNPKPLFSRQFELADKISQWFQMLVSEPSGFQQVFRNLIQTNLKFALYRLVALGKSKPALDAGYDPNYYLNTFSSEAIWELDRDSILAAVFTPASRDTMRRELERRLRETFQVWIKGMQQIVQAAPQYFPKSLEIAKAGQAIPGAIPPAGAFQNHEPHMGLLFAFLKLFEQVRDRLNEHSKNHLEYYFKRILQLNEQPAIPDQAHVVFEVSDPLPFCLLPKGTTFTAGADALGVEQIFRLDEELLVQRARIANLRSFFTEQKTVFKTINGQEIPFRAIKGLYAAIQANSADGRGAGFDGIDPPSWPTLGRKLSRMPDPNEPGRIIPHPPARLGIALASRVLYLREGRRTITFHISCDLPNYLQNSKNSDFLSLQEAIKTKFLFTSKTTAGLIEAGLDPNKVRTMAYLYGIGPKTVQEFRDFTQAQGLAPDQELALKKNIERTLAFRISLSGEKEIFQPYEVEMDLTLKSGRGEFRISVELGPEDSPVVYFDPELYGFDLGTRLPTAQLELNPDISFFIETKDENGNNTSEEVGLYQAFRQMKIADLWLEVFVQGVRDLIVQNADGPQDPGGPFPPFGVAPKPGADFYIGSREAFHKRLFSPDDNTPGLSLRMVWDELPGSFFEHYRMYGAQVLRSDFTGSLSMRNNSAWANLDNGALKTILTNLDVRITPNGNNFDFSVTGKDNFVFLQNFDPKNSNPYSLNFAQTISTPTSLQEAKETLGYALFLALDPANYKRYNYPGTGQFEFHFEKSVTTNNAGASTTTVTLLARTGKFSAGEDETEAKNKIIAALTNPEIFLTVNNFGNLQATPVEEQSAFTIASRNGFIRLQLGSQDFLHSRFPVVLPTQSAAVALAAQLTALPSLPAGTVTSIENAFYRKNNDPSAVKKGTAINNQYTDYTPELPNEPHTPMIKEISLDYRAIGATYELEAFHLFPFEQTNSLRLNLLEQSPSLLPVFADSEGEGVTLEKEGVLYIALDQLAPGNTLSLLFQVAEATADPDLEKITPSWHYLHDNQWVRLEPDQQVLSDETKGLLVSGVVQLAIPRNINRNNTILPPSYYWLKVSAAERSAAASQTLAIYPQAARLTFVPQTGNDLERLAAPLPAELIANFVQENPAVKSIVQPYQSFGGKLGEKEDRFYTRVSERLQHKGRAITLFDYESLLLENFPDVFRAKCVTHTLGRRGQVSDVELAPSYITVAVIPDLRTQKFADRLKPKFSVGALREMEDFLKARCSPFVRLQVLNPRYQPVNIEGKIKYRPGKSAEYYRLVLEKEVINFLSPWASGEQDRISFGGEIFKSYVLNFIEQRDYVDYVTDFIMRDELGNEVNLVTARTARSVIVSGFHILDILE